MKNNRRKKDSNSIMKRHLTRVQLKRKQLEDNHERILNQVNQVYSKINLIKKTYGLIKCLFNRYLQSQLKQLKSMVKSLKNSGQKIVDLITNYQHKESLPFV